MNVSDNRKVVNLFDNDFLFKENVKRNKRENFVNMQHIPTADISYSKTQLTKSVWEGMDLLEEDLNPSAHLQFQYINNYKPLSKTQRLNSRILSDNAYKESLKEIYN